MGMALNNVPWSELDNYDSVYKGYTDIEDAITEKFL